MSHQSGMEDEDQSWLFKIHDIGIKSDGVKLIPLWEDEDLICALIFKSSF